MKNEEISLFLKNIYSTNSIYVLNYPEGKEVVVSYGQAPKIEEQKIYHKCRTNIGSSGSPILLSNNQKVIGVHYGTSSHFQFNKGILIVFPIIEFNKKEINLKLNENKNNRIECDLLEFEFIDNHYLINNEIKNEELYEIVNKISDLCKQLENERDKNNYKSLINNFLLINSYYNSNEIEEFENCFFQM